MKFLLVDDHSLIRDAVRAVLKELDDSAICYEASRWKDALPLLDQHPDLDLVLLDLGLPDHNGFAALAELQTRRPKTPAVVLSGSSDGHNVERALDLGAVGFIPKSGEREVMVNALRLIFAGGVYIPPEIRVRSSGPGPGQFQMRDFNGVPPKSPADLGLTGRQIDVLGLMMRGKSNKAIGRMLDLAEPTVKNHVTAILKSLGVTNRTEAVLAIAALGWDRERLPG